MKSNPDITESELTSKLECIHGLLERLDLDALLLRRSDNFAWATCGASSFINRADSLGVASLLVTRQDRWLLTNTIEAGRLDQEEGLGGQGWEFKVSPWYEDKNRLSELTRGMKLGTDATYANALDVTAELNLLRSQLTSEEGQRFRVLAELCAAGMREAGLAVRPGMTEFEICGLLSQAVESRGVQAIVNLVATDERISAYRHPLPTSRKLEHYAMLIVCGRRWGLICSLTRLIHFGKLPSDLRHKADAIARIDTEMISATRPGSSLGDVFHTAQSAYEKAGFPGEWKLHHQGGSAGYAPREITATPSSHEAILVGQAFAWNPSITGVKSEDTILVGEHENEILTEMADWPTLEVDLGGRIIRRPAILEKY